MQHEGYRHRFFLICFFFFIGCASSDYRNRAFYQRTKEVSYEVLDLKSNGMNSYFQTHFLLEKNDRYDVHGFSDGDSYILIADSGEKETKEVACTLLKAEGRIQIVKWLSQQLYQKNQGKPWDLYLRNMTEATLNNKLKSELVKDKRVSFYTEERLRGEKKRFVCAVAVSLTEESWQNAVKPLFNSIQDEYFHLSLSELDLRFPLSQ